MCRQKKKDTKIVAACTCIERMQGLNLSWDCCFILCVLQVHLELTVPPTLSFLSPNPQEQTWMPRIHKKGMRLLIKP